MASDSASRSRCSDIERIIITHGHIDHFGGLAFVKTQAEAEVGIHELDRRVLTNYEERVIVATKALGIYLRSRRNPAVPARNTVLHVWFRQAARHIDRR